MMAVWGPTRVRLSHVEPVRRVLSIGVMFQCRDPLKGSPTRLATCVARYRYSLGKGYIRLATCLNHKSRFNATVISLLIAEER